MDSDGQSGFEQTLQSLRDSAILLQSALEPIDPLSNHSHLERPSDNLISIISRLTVGHKGEWNYPPPPINPETNRKEGYRSSHSRTTTSDVQLGQPCLSSMAEIIRSRELYGLSRRGRAPTRKCHCDLKSQSPKRGRTVRSTSSSRTMSPIRSVSSSPVRSVVNWVASALSRVSSPVRRPHTPSGIDLLEDQEYAPIKPRTNLHDSVGPWPITNMVQQIQSFGASRLPETLIEKQFNSQMMDKVFSSAWLSSSELLLGTKCNKLILLNLYSGKSTPLTPLIRTIEMLTNLTNTQHFHVPIDIPRIFRPSSSGMHSISINPSKTMVAIGSGKPLDFIHVYSLPSMIPIAALEGHTDLVFSVTWTSDSTLISGSRDTTIKAWKLTDDFISKFETLPSGEPIAIYQPTSSHEEHQGKVRALVYNSRTSDAASLSLDGTMRIWDASNPSALISKNSIPLLHTNETVCLTFDKLHNLYTVGSQSHASIFDPRSNSFVHTLDSRDEGWGVRSMLMERDVLTIGGGMGRISFYDLRAQDYIEWETNGTSNETTMVRTFNDDGDTIMSTRETSHTTGSGWLFKDPIYMTHFQGVSIRNAVYTMSYQEGGAALFAAGGPLQLNLKGSYISLWH